MKLFLSVIVVLMSSLSVFAVDFEVCKTNEKARIEAAVNSQADVSPYIELFRKVSLGISTAEKQKLASNKVRQDVLIENQGFSEKELNEKYNGNKAYDEISAFGDGLKKKIVSLVGGRKVQIGGMEFISSPVRPIHSVDIDIESGYLKLCVESFPINSGGSVSQAPLVIVTNDTVVYKMCVYEVEGSIQTGILVDSKKTQYQDRLLQIKSVSESLSSQVCNGF